MGMSWIQLAQKRYQQTHCHVRKYTGLN